MLETFGPVIVNDISAGEMDPAIVDVVAEYDAPYIAMHMRGTPATMQGMTSYRDCGGGRSFPISGSVPSSCVAAACVG